VNLAQGMEKVGDLRSRRWTSTDAQRVFRVSVMEPTLKQLASECPEAFIPDEETSIVYRDWTDTSMGRTLTATTDPYVLSFGLVATTGGVEPVVVDGTWDAIYWLEVTQADGTVLTRRCREFFIAQPAGEPAERYYVSLDKVWPNSTDTGMSFRLYQPYFYTRDDVTDVIDGRVRNQHQQVVFTVPAGAVRFFQEEDYRGTGSGTPRRLSRWGHEQIPAPNRTPTAATPSQDPPVPWLGPEPPGTFRYLYTYVWGKRDPELVAPGGTLDPMLESAPSPVSNLATVPNMVNAVVLSGLTNIDYEQKFYAASSPPLRSGHSGWRKRIYRARTSVIAGTATVDNIEFPENVYFFLAEVDGATTGYTDNGTVTPDYHRRLPESTGYFKWVLSPHADGQYTVDWRVYRRPGPLLADTDTPPVHPDFEDMLLTLLCKWAAMADKQPAEAADYQAQFIEKLGKWRAKDANPAAAIIPISWSMQDWGEWNRYSTFTSTT
jgi:hypothetical protein